VCDEPLRHTRRIPVCSGCLESIQPLSHENTCGRCGKACEGKLSETFAQQGLPERGVGLCLGCTTNPPPYDAAISWTAYEGVARELIHLLKYDRVLPVASYLAERLNTLPASTAELVAAVPLARARQRERRFNQAALIARRLARLRRTPFSDRLLVRRRETQSQAGLTAEERERNVNGAFGMVDARKVKGKRVLLVDDILTTGATARECAAVLKRAGASYIGVLTVARADLRRIPGVASVASLVEEHSA
jgi:ComF family protein